MESLFNFIVANQDFAPWLLFALVVITSLYDVAVIIAAILASRIIPDQSIALFLTTLAGCHISALLSYAIGRFAGEKIRKGRFLRRFFHAERMGKIERFHCNRNVYTLIATRFIPFGVRDSLFISAGMSRAPFFRFVMQDILATSIWFSIAFSVFYALGENFEQMLAYTKMANILIFSAFSVTVIAIFWYKRRRRLSTKDVDTLDV